MAKEIKPYSVKLRGSYNDDTWHGDDGAVKDAAQQLVYLVCAMYDKDVPSANVYLYAGMEYDTGWVTNWCLNVNDSDCNLWRGDTYAREHFELVLDDFLVLEEPYEGVDGHEDGYQPVDEYAVFDKCKELAHDMASTVFNKLKQELEEYNNSQPDPEDVGEEDDDDAIDEATKLLAESDDGPMPKHFMPVKARMYGNGVMFTLDGRTFLSQGDWEAALKDCWPPGVKDADDVKGIYDEYEQFFSEGDSDEGNEFQCEKCGEIFEPEPYAKITLEQNPSGGEIGLTKCPHCGGDAWSIES